MSSPILITVQFPLSLNSSFIYFYYTAYLTFFAAVDTRFVLMTSFKNSFPLFYIFGLLTEKKRIRNTKREKKTKRKIVHRFQVVKGLTFLQTSDDNLLFLKKSWLLCCNLHLWVAWNMWGGRGRWRRGFWGTSHDYSTISRRGSWVALGEMQE